jgi:hypothetical protein
MELLFQKTVLEFKKRNMDESLPITSDTAGEIVEVQWFDTENGTWTTIRETFAKAVSMGKKNHFLKYVYEQTATCYVNVCNSHSYKHNCDWQYSVQHNFQCH